MPPPRGERASSLPSGPLPLPRLPPRARRYALSSEWRSLSASSSGVARRKLVPQHQEVQGLQDQLDEMRESVKQLEQQRAEAAASPARRNVVASAATGLVGAALAAQVPEDGHSLRARAARLRRASRRLCCRRGAGYDAAAGGGGRVV
ncbi:MAG: hypothetical protein VX017_10820, partial [Pseudomonadota bacterium]|nr:hypothetical protein [Pseudomonadota bacterium]